MILFIIPGFAIWMPQCRWAMRSVGPIGPMPCARAITVAVARAQGAHTADTPS